MARHPGFKSLEIFYCCFKNLVAAEPVASSVTRRRASAIGICAAGFKNNLNLPIDVYRRSNNAELCVGRDAVAFNTINVFFNYMLSMLTAK